MKEKQKKLAITAVLLVPVVLGVVVSYSLQQTPTHSIERTQSFERTIASKSSGTRRVDPSGQEFLDYEYTFNDESFATISEEARNKLFSLECYDADVLTYKKGAIITSNVVGPSSDEFLNAYICENNILRFESFSELFDGSQTLYSIVNSMRDGNMITLPLFDDLQSIRIHSDARRNNPSSPEKTSEYYEPEVTPIEVHSDEGPVGAASSDNTAFTLWGRWAEATYGRQLSFSDSREVTVDKFSARRWLSMFFDYFSGSAGPSCLNIWKDFDGLDYIWNTLFTHEMYHHYISPSIRDSSNIDDPQIDYSYYKVSGLPPTFSSVKETEQIRESLWDVTSSYFGDLKTAYWDNESIADSAATQVDLSSTIGTTNVAYELSVSDLQYIYEPEELVARLMSLLTFHWKDLNLDLLGLDYSGGFDICRPSFFMKDLLAFQNEEYDINPFTPQNFNNAVGVVLNYLKFDKEVAYIKKGNGNSGGISLQGWSKPGEHQKIVFEETNPSEGSIATKRNIVDLSWSASNFFVRESFNNEEKKYVQCSDDLTVVTLVNQWANSCQMWTTPLIDVNGLFDRFLAPSTDEVNIYTDDDAPQIAVGFNVYFWDDRNSNGLIDETEKNLITTTAPTSLNSRLQDSAPSTDCKISLFSDTTGSKLIRYVDDSYADSLNDIDTICRESWTITTTSA